MSNKYVSVLLLFLTISVSVAAQDAWLTNYDEAIKKASAESKPVLISFAGSDWCKPCIKLTREVFESEQFMAYAKDNLVLLLLDFPRLKKNKLPKEQQEHNDKLAARFNKTGEFPLVVVIDPQEKLLAKTGYQPGGAKNFITMLDKEIK